MRNWIVLLIAMTFSIPALAVEKEEKKTISDKRLLNMQKQWQLSDEQRVEMRQVRDEGGSKKEVRAVLTEEQREQLQELKKERQKKQADK